jgi:hypothetical protein
MTYSRSIYPSLALALAGCVAPGDDGAATDPADAVLPAPAVWRVRPPVLDAEAARRQAEVDRFIADELYRGYTIVETTQTYGGDLIDWIDPATVPGSQLEPPPPLTAADLATPPGVALQPTEVDGHPELRGPAGAIPFVRPQFAPYVRGDASADTLAEYARAVPTGQPAGWDRLYAGYSKAAINTSVASFIDHAFGQVEPGTFSLIETATTCKGPSPATTLELVGGVVGRMPVLDDSKVRLRVEFIAQGTAFGGDYIAGWDGWVKGFVAYAGRPYGPNVALLSSLAGGTQYESQFTIRLHAGNWWIAHNGNWLGYYPGSLFNLINGGGCEARWYGEVYDPTPTVWTATDMGFGFLANAGYSFAATVRNPSYVSSGTTYWPDGASTMLPIDTLCYSKTALAMSASPWDRYFYIGGPGGNGIGCF